MSQKCTASCKDGSECNAYAINGEDKCRMHLGTSLDKSSHEGNTNAVTHGMRASPNNLFDALPDEQQAWIFKLAERYRKQAGIETEDPRYERIRRACIHMVQSMRGEKHIIEQGLSEENTIGIDGDGNPVVKKEGHHLHKHMMERDSEARMILKDLGLLNSPEQQQADAMQGLADAFSEMDDDDVIDV